MSRWWIRIAAFLVPVALIFALVFWQLSNAACDSYVAAESRPGIAVDDCVTTSVWGYLLLMVLMILIAIVATTIAVGAYFWGENRRTQTVSFIPKDR